MSRSLPNRTFFSISQVSIAVGVSADTLRRLETKGKIKPKRGSGKRRLYSLDDVALLRQILKKPDQKKSFTIRQAADILAISVDTLRRWEKKGKIKGMRTPGGHRRFSFEAIEKVKETKYQPTPKPTPLSVKKIIQPEPKPEPKPIHVTPQPGRTQVYFNLSLIAFVIVSTFMMSIVRLSAMVIGQANELAMQAEVQIVDLEGRVLGVETEGGSVVTLARVLDSDFNLSVNGYVEGSVLRSTTSSDAPLVVESDTKVENLNADLLDGQDWTDLPDLITEASPDMWDFSEFKDSMALDASTNIALGSLTLSTSGTGALDFNSTGQVSFAGNVDAENGLDVTGNLTASGDLTVSGGDITLGTASIFSGGDTASLNNIDSIDSTTEGTFESALDFLRSDDSDSYTSGTLSFSDGTFLDLSAIIHNDSALQGLRLPQNTSLTSPSSGEGFVAWDTDDNKLQVFNGSAWVDVSAAGGSSAFADLTSGTNTTAAMVVGNEASLTYSGTGTITASDLTCTDCLDFTEFADSLTLDVATDIALGSATLSTSGTGALDFNSTGQVSFAGNVNAENGLDVTTADLTVGGANFSVAQASGNITTAGVLDVNGGGTSDIAGTLNLSGSSLTTTGALAFTPGGVLTIGATGQNLTLQGAITALTSTGSGNNITLTAADDIIFTDNQVTSILLSEIDTTLPNSNTGIVDAINDAYDAAVASGPWTRDSGSGTIYPTTLGDKVGIGTTTPGDIISKLFVTGNSTLTGKSVAIFDQTETEDILTASASGQTKFVINNSGYVGVLTDTPLGVLTIENSGLATSEELLTFGTSAGYNWAGTAIDFNYVINQGTGIEFGTIYGTTGRGIHFTDIRSPGTGIYFDLIYTGGVGIHADLSSSAATALKVSNTKYGYINAYTYNIIDISSSRETTVADVYVDTANFLNITRADETSGASSDLTYADLVEFSSNCTQTAGTCTDASNILVLEQNYASATGSVLEITNSGSGAEIDFLSTSPTINTANTGTLAFSDGSTTLAAIKDQGVYPFFNIAGKTDTGDPGTCAEGDIYYNAFDDTISVCHSGSTWEQLDGGGGSTAFSDITSGTNTSAAMIVDSEASLTYSGSGTITASDLTCTDCLDFDEIVDSATLDGPDGAASWSIGAANTKGITITSDLSGGARSSSLLTLSQANDATYNSTANLLSISQLDTGSTVPAVSITQNANSISTSALYLDISGGTASGLHIPTITGTNQMGISIYTPTGTNAKGINISASGVTSGAGISLSGQSIGGIPAFTGDMIAVDIQRNWNGSTTLDDTGNYLNIIRAITNSGSGTYTISGDLTTLSSNCTQTSGTCTDTSNILELSQQYAAASGSILNVLGAGTGNLAVFDASNASANGISIDVQSSSSSQYDLSVTSNNAAINGLYVRADGNVGIGDTTPSVALNVGTGNTDHGLSGTGAEADLFVSDDLEVDGILILDSGIIHNSNATAAIFISTSITDTPSELTEASWLIKNNRNVGQAALMVDQEMSGDLFTASASGTTKFRIANDGSVTIDGVDTMLTVGSGSGKIDVGTVDPVYNIGGEKYATYMAGMIGVKEEITNSITTDEYIPGVGYRHVIDFTNQEKDSDLWLFSKTTDIGKHIDDLIVLLSASENTRSWYEIDEENYTLSIYSSRPTTISYRLTAPRFDAAEWTNFNTNPESFGFVVNDDELIGTGEFNQEIPTLSDYEIFMQNTGYQIRTISGEIIEGVEAFASLAVANIKAGAIETGELTTDTFLAFQGTIDNLLIKGGLVSPTVKTQEISPIEDSDLVINLENSAPEATESSFGRLIIEGVDSKEVASIDAEGNATFSGTLQSEEVKTNEIIADKIYANEIISKTGYFDSISTATSSAITREEIEDLLREAQEDQALLAETSSWNVDTGTDSANLNDLTVKNIYITNQTTTSSLSVMASITIGSDLVIQGSSEGLLASSIDTLTKPLQIQSLGLAPVEIMAGKVKINTDGDIEVAGNLYIAGTIESSGLTLKETDRSEADNGFSKLLSVKASSGDEVASIDASGSAKFASVFTNNLEITSQEGRVLGNENIRDAAAILPGETTINVQKGWQAQPASILVSPTYNAQAWVTNLSATGFTINVNTPPEDTQTIFWWAIW